MSSTVAARIPEDIAEEIEFLAEEGKTDKSKIIRGLLSDAVKERLLDIALKKYSEREISMGRASEMAKMPLADFMKKAAEKNIPLDYPPESLKKDFLAAKK